MNPCLPAESQHAGAVENYHHGQNIKKIGPADVDVEHLRREEKAYSRQNRNQKPPSQLVAHSKEYHAGCGISGDIGEKRCAKGKTQIVWKKLPQKFDVV